MLIDDIITILGNETGSLTDALVKTKILLYEIGNKELVEWVNNELNGYSNSDDVPPYRILPSHVFGNLSNPVSRYRRHPIPLGHLPTHIQDSLVRSKMPQSVASLEDLAKQQKPVSRPIPMECNHSLGEQLDNSFRVERAWCEIAIHDVKSIIVNVRSRLLDFMLELRESVGHTTTDAELREKSSSVDAQGLFHHAIFGAGSNTTILIGNQSSITATQTINANEFAGRVQKLIDQVEQILPTSGLPSSVQEGSKVVLAELRDAATAQAPDVSRLRRGLVSLTHVMEHATGHLVATGVLALIGELLSHAAH
jgi:hypothetical protein